jgi:hypothetical protein
MVLGFKRFQNNLQNGGAKDLHLALQKKIELDSQTPSLQNLVPKIKGKC